MPCPPEGTPHTWRVPAASSLRELAEEGPVKSTRLRASIKTIEEWVREPVGELVDVPEGVSVDVPVEPVVPRPVGVDVNVSVAEREGEG